MLAADHHTQPKPRALPAPALATERHLPRWQSRRQQAWDQPHSNTLRPAHRPRKCACVKAADCQKHCRANFQSDPLPPDQNNTWVGYQRAMNAQSYVQF